ncbi:hypothetical protein FACS1894206_08280 [Deltaproteobacteria bacterium]|nr:hypothetical protein FACS1894206_08280 [Deltaproteobacteria bacterium]
MSRVGEQFLMNQIDPVGPNVSFLFMPIDGVAAYWLSLHKLLGASRNTRALEAEAHFVGEPFIRHLLDMLMSPVSAARCRIFAEICGKSEINRLDRQFDLMRITIMDMATGENPLRTLARFTARFPGYIADPEGMLEQGQAQLNEALNGTLPADAYRIDHTLSDEVLIARLLFYATLCRRHGKSSCRGFLPQEGSVFFHRCPRPCP